MALNTTGAGGSASTNYLNVYQGNLVFEYDTREALEDKLEALGLDPNNIKVRQRTMGKNEGKDVFFFILFDISGKLTNINIRETSFGEFVELEFMDVDERIVVSLGDVSSRMSKDFTRRVGNLDLNEDVTFGVWNITAEESNNGKAKSGVWMKQGDKKIEYFISYEDMPEPTQKKRGSKTTWDYTDQENFLYESLISFKDENFKGVVTTQDEQPAKQPAKQVTKQAPKRVAKVADVEKDDDDLPF